MEGSESPEGGGGGGRNNGGGHLGVNKMHSGKISKVVKRSVIQPPKPQAPVYTIDKNDFRLVVQKLTGSSAPPQAAPPNHSPPRPPPPPPPPPNPSPPPPIQNPNNPSRFQRSRPPPLQSVQSFNKLVSNLTPTTIPPPSRHQSTTFAFRPTPTHSTFRFPQFSAPPFSSSTAPPFQLPPPPTNFNLSSAFSRPPPLMAAPPPLPSSGAPQFLAFSPLPSPSSQFQISSFSGSQVPFSPGSIFPLSPSGHFGPLQPQSPGSFPLSPQFPFTSF